LGVHPVDGVVKFDGGGPGFETIRIELIEPEVTFKVGNPHSIGGGYAIDGGIVGLGVIESRLELLVDQVELAEVGGESLTIDLASSDLLLQWP